MVRSLAVALGVLVCACTVDPLATEGRPCSPSAPCGPGTVCDPTSGRCVGQAPDGPRSEAADTGPLVDVPWAPEGGGLELGPDQQLVDQQLGAEQPLVQDRDNDTIPDPLDNCPDTPNKDQKNADTDSFGNVCDNCPNITNNSQADGDSDTVGDDCDNCPVEANAGQSDLDSDGIGDLCDPDRDGDTVPNAIDPDPDVVDTVYYYKQPMNKGDFNTSGDWTTPQSDLCQEKLDSKLQKAWLPNAPATSDYLVETRATVVQTSTSGGWPAVGVIFRGSNVGSSLGFGGYICLVDLQARRLVLGSYANGTLSERSSSPTNSVPQSNTYRIQAKAKGSALSCTLLGTVSPLFVTASDSAHSSGTVGLTTFNATACFEYLLATKL